MKVAAKLASLLVVILFSSGCTTLWVSDRLPKDAPKGYVEFYAAYGETPGKDISIIDVATGDSEALHQYERNRLRFACAPGAHTFLIAPRFYANSGHPEPKPLTEPEIAVFLAMDSQLVAVNVVETKVTPVRVIFSEISRAGNNVRFNMKYTVESPQTLEQHQLRITQQNAEKRPKQSASSPATVSLTAQYPISGATFSVAGGDVRQTFEARELLDRAAKGLDLTKESDKAEFVKRYQEERKKHPELQNLIIMCPAIKGL